MSGFWWNFQDFFGWLDCFTFLIYVWLRYAFNRIHSKMPYAKYRPFCSGLNMSIGGSLWTVIVWVHPYGSPDILYPYWYTHWVLSDHKWKCCFSWNACPCLVFALPNFSTPYASSVKLQKYRAGYFQNHHVSDILGQYHTNGVLVPDNSSESVNVLVVDSIWVSRQSKHFCTAGEIANH